MKEWTLVMGKLPTRLADILHFRSHEVFSVDQIIRDFLHNYYHFSIKLYVMGIY